uniref:Uncharacterized protein n=1 Tax=Mus musculus TaxID=10090 RepID=Q3U003_MOUSE|nr:unnamed protein product [Mus musculus]
MFIKWRERSFFYTHSKGSSKHSTGVLIVLWQCPHNSARVVHTSTLSFSIAFFFYCFSRPPSWCPLRQSVLSFQISLLLNCPSKFLYRSSTLFAEGPDARCSPFSPWMSCTSESLAFPFSPCCFIALLLLLHPKPFYLFKLWR